MLTKVINSRGTTLHTLIKSIQIIKASDRNKHWSPCHLIKYIFPPPSAHEVRSINDLFRPHDFIRLVVSSMVVQVFFFRQIDSQGLILCIWCFPICQHDLTTFVHIVIIYLKMLLLQVILKCLHSFYGQINCNLLCVWWIPFLQSLVF